MLGGSAHVPAFLSECSGSSSVAVCIMVLAVEVVALVWVLQLLMWAADMDGRGVVASMGDWGVMLGAMGAGSGLFFIWGSHLIGTGGHLHTEVGSGGGCLGVDINSGGGIGLGLGVLQ